jgi:hypothetical protein
MRRIEAASIEPRRVGMMEAARIVRAMIDELPKSVRYSERE